MDPLTKTEELETSSSPEAPSPPGPQRLAAPEAPSHDALGPARGILLAALFGLIAWGIIFFLVWLILLR